VKDINVQCNELNVNEKREDCKRWCMMFGPHEAGGTVPAQYCLASVSLSPRPKPTPARIAFSMTRVLYCKQYTRWIKGLGMRLGISQLVKVIRAGVGLGLGPRLCLM